MYIDSVWNCRRLPPEIAKEPWPKISGSVNSCMPAIVEMITVKMMAGLIIGMVMLQNCRTFEAPSTVAASYRSRGIACIAAR